MEMFYIGIFTLIGLLSVTQHIYMYTSPVYVWPLYYQNPTLELHGMTTDGHRGCSVFSGDKYLPSLDYNAIMLQGTSQSYVDINITDDNMFDDFGISITVRGGSGTSGTIFHYQAVAGDEDGYVTDIIIWYDSMGIYVDLYGPTASKLATLISNVQMVSNTWVTYLLSYDVSKPELVMSSSSTGTSIGTIGWWSGNSQLRVPGVMRVGAAIEDVSYPAFNGQAICLSMYDVKMWTSDIPNSVAECTVESWISDPSAAGGGCGEYKGYIKLHQADAAVAASIAIFKTRQSSTRLRCADLCMFYNTCSSFTYNKDTSLCNLYDADYQVNLVFDLGTGYYIKRDVSCC